MINKIYKCRDYNVYYRVTFYDETFRLFQGIVIKSNSVAFDVGREYHFILKSATELTEEQFNKIMVFE